MKKTEQRQASALQNWIKATKKKKKRKIDQIFGFLFCCAGVAYCQCARQTHTFFVLSVCTNDAVNDTSDHVVFGNIVGRMTRIIQPPELKVWIRIYSPLYSILVTSCRCWTTCYYSEINAELQKIHGPGLTRTRDRWSKLLWVNITPDPVTQHDEFGTIVKRQRKQALVYIFWHWGSRWHSNARPQECPPAQRLGENRYKSITYSDLLTTRANSLLLYIVIIWGNDDIKKKWMSYQ